MGATFIEMPYGGRIDIAQHIVPVLQFQSMVRVSVGRMG